MDNYSWLQLEQTQKLLQNLVDTKRQIEEKLGQGATLSDTADKTALLTARFSGYAQSLNETSEYIRGFQVEPDVDSEGEV